MKVDSTLGIAGEQRGDRSEVLTVCLGDTRRRPGHAQSGRTAKGRAGYEIRDCRGGAAPTPWSNGRTTTHG